MLRVFLLIAVAFSAVLAHKKECGHLFHPKNFMCCKQTQPHDDFMHVKECMENHKPPPNCESDICVAKHVGVTTVDDGTFDKKALEALINDKLEKMPELAESIVKNCINGDLSNFGPPDFCDLTKFRHCHLMHLLAACPEWDTSAAYCVETKEELEKCFDE